MLYLQVPNHGRLLLIEVYGKNEQENFSAQDLKEFRSLVQEYKDTLDQKSKIRFKTVHFSPEIRFNLVHSPRLLFAKGKGGGRAKSRGQGAVLETIVGGLDAVHPVRSGGLQNRGRLPSRGVMGQ